MKKLLVISLLVLSFESKAQTDTTLADANIISFGALSGKRLIDISADKFLTFYRKPNSIPAAWRSRIIAYIELRLTRIIEDSSNNRHRGANY